MSPKLIVCLFVFGFVCSVFGGQWQTEPYEHPGEHIWSKSRYHGTDNFVLDYPGQCYDKEINEPVAVGEISRNSMGCKWQKCQPDFSFFVAK